MLKKSQSKRRKLALTIIPICAMTAGDHSVALSQSADALALPVRKDQPDFPSGLLTKTRSNQQEKATAASTGTPESTASSAPVTRPPESPAPAPERVNNSSTIAAQPTSTRRSADSAKPTESSIEADLALVAHLRPESTRQVEPLPAPRVEFASLEPTRTSTASTRSPRQTTSPGRAATDNSPPAPPAIAADQTTDFNTEATSGEESADVNLAPSPEAMAAATVPARIPQPNLYLPQQRPTQRTQGLLSRLFNRRNNAPDRRTAAAPTSFHFNSDYATRTGHEILPAVLPGNGIGGADLPLGGEDAYRLTNSLPQDFRPTDLVCLPTQLCHYGNPLYLRQEAAYSLCQMINAAAAEGLTIRVVSAYRDYAHQNRLYMRAVARHGPNQKRVARPGRSEHILGTTVDVTNNSQHVLKRSFGDTPEGRWLQANAEQFGWKLTVMSGNGKGPNDEPWHLRYFGSGLNNPPSRSIVAHPDSRGQRRDVFGSIGRALGLRR